VAGGAAVYVAKRPDCSTQNKDMGEPFPVLGVAAEGARRFMSQSGRTAARKTGSDRTWANLSRFYIGNGNPVDELILV